jgi:hypothetical protein
VTFFLVMTYILKARGLTSARELGGGIFSRTVMMRAVKDPTVLSATAPLPPGHRPTAPLPVVQLSVPGHQAPDPPTVIAGSIPPFAPPEPTGAIAMPDAPITGSPVWRLRGLAGPLAGRTFPLMGLTLIGRDPVKCPVHIEESTVSREHAAVEPDPTTAAWRVRRVSRNGYVYLNGSAVDEALLSPGDQIQLGSSIFILEVGVF